MRRRVYDKSHWCDFFYNSAVSDFYKGVDFLGVASTRLRIRMPRVVKRNLASGAIEDIHYWDKENKKADATRHWPGHEALDDPNTPKSRVFYEFGTEGSGYPDAHRSGEPQPRVRCLQDKPYARI